MRRVALSSRTTQLPLGKAVPACRPGRARPTRLRPEQHLQEIEYHVSACWQGIQGLVLDLHLLQQAQRSDLAGLTPAAWRTLLQPMIIRLNAHLATLARTRRFGATLLWEEHQPAIEQTADATPSMRLLAQSLEQAVQDFEEQCYVMLQILPLLLERWGSMEENGRAGGI